MIERGSVVSEQNLSLFLGVDVNGELKYIIVLYK